MCKVCEGTADNRGHVWKMVDGQVDIFAVESGFHNGLQCERCGYYFCHHCQEGPEEDCAFKGQQELPL